jgi:hypothetical protein
MQSPIASLRRPDLHLPEIDVSSIDLSNLQMPKVDGPTVSDIQKAVRDTAVNAGLVERRRSRWPFILGAVVVAGVGVAVLNSSAIRERFERARAWLMDRTNAMADADRPEEPVAFPAADPKPIEEPAYDMASTSTTDDYPAGLGSPTEQVATNGRSTVASSR